ncbi:DUF1345 domain-containing protein [Alsobacter sp. KACC 23698]|uniref:DUF1345 domain-containing protein n=1 Tax=Alsobacter sp. KACC 23698 TaxID=3149229 RepID=A0AAU7JD96_9HYPH
MSGADRMGRAALPDRLRRIVQARGRLLASAALAAATLLALPGGLRFSTRLLIAWDLGTLLYIGLIVAMMRRSDVDLIRSRSAFNDENRFTILLLIVGATMASFAAIVAELVNGRVQGVLQAGPMALAGVTVLLSWTFTHVVFAMHYAHEFYACDEQKDREGLKFPGEASPGYNDFLYFSFVIGCAAQTADVDVTASGMRSIVLVHGVVSFLFNTAILALTINIAAGLIGSGPGG